MYYGETVNVVEPALACCAVVAAAARLSVVDFVVEFVLVPEELVAVVAVVLFPVALWVVLTSSVRTYCLEI